MTTKKTGVGLGLSIVSKIMDEHHGSIRVESAPGQGACFVLFFPAEERQCEPAENRVGHRMSAQPTILIVEDEAKMRRLLELNLGEDGFTVLSAGDAETGLKMLAGNSVDLVVTDLKLPGMDGLEFLQSVKRHERRDTRSCDDRVRLGRDGGRRHEGRRQRLRAEAILAGRNAHGGAQGTRHRTVCARRTATCARRWANAMRTRTSWRAAPKMQEVLATVERVAPTNSTVLLGGESGVGKDLIARAIHEKSRRASGPFIKINSTAIPENLLESELFGYEKGAFTGADEQQARESSRLADKGTLFLDEIGDVPPATQVKAAASAAGARVRAPGRNAYDQSRRAAGRGNQSRPARGARRRHISRGPLLSAERCADRDCAAARAQGRHSGTGGAVRQAVCQGLRQASSTAFRRRPCAS